MYVIQNFFGKVGTVKARSTLINLSVAHQLCRFFKTPFYAQHKKQPQTKHLKRCMSKSMQKGANKKGLQSLETLYCIKWELTGSNRRPSACKADALNQLS